MKHVELGRIIEPAELRRAGNGDFPVLSMTMRSGLVDQAEKFKKRVASADTSAYKVVERNQLVVGFPIDEGVLAFQRLYDEAIVSPAYNVWNLQKDAAVERKYLELFLRSPIALAFYKSKLQNTTARRRSISNDLFLSLKVPLPPLTEQERIVGILDEADALRQRRAQADRRTAEFIPALFHEMFGEPATNSKCWPRSLLGDKLSLLDYGPRFYNEPYSEDGIRITRITDLDSDGNLDFEAMPRMRIARDVIEAKKLQLADIIVARSGATVGKSAIIKKSDPECIAGAYFVRLHFDKAIDPVYGRAWLNHPHIQRMIFSGSSQSAQPNCNGPTLRALPFLVPPVRLQREFAERVAEVRGLEAAQAQSRQRLDALFASLLDRAFKGEL